MLILTAITVVNTTAQLQRAAADAVKRGRFLYWRDDTHWNDDGVRVAANQVATALAAEHSIDRPPSIKSVSEQRIP